MVTKVYTAKEMLEFSTECKSFEKRLDRISEIIFGAAKEGEVEVNLIRLEGDVEEELKNNGYKVYHVGSYESYKYIPGTVVISWRE